MNAWFISCCPSVVDSLPSSYSKLLFIYLLSQYVLMELFTKHSYKSIIGLLISSKISCYRYLIHFTSFVHFGLRLIGHWAYSKPPPCLSSYLHSSFPRMQWQEIITGNLNQNIVKWKIDIISHWTRSKKKYSFFFFIFYFISDYLFFTLVFYSSCQIFDCLQKRCTNKTPSFFMYYHYFLSVCLPLPSKI